MSRAGAIITLAAMLALTSQGAAHGGECVGPEEDYVAALEKGLRFSSRADSVTFSSKRARRIPRCVSGSVES